MVSKKRAVKKRAVKKRSAKLATKTIGRPRSTRRPGRANRAGHDAVVIERQSRALELRKRGYRYRAIASELQVSVRTAYSDVQTVLAEVNALVGKQAEDVRALELERYDGYLRSLQPLIDGSDLAAKLRAIGLALGVAARRAKLLGIDAVQTGPSADEIMRTAGMLVTIIQSHVHDQRILDAIADQFEEALGRLDPSGLAVIETTPVDHG